MRPITRASAVLLGLLVVHLADHAVRQHRSVPSELGIVGTLGMVGVVAVLVLSLAKRSQAAPLAAAVGVGTGFGFLAVHVLPDWGPVSDPYPAAHLDALSWAVMIAPMAAGFWLGAVGAVELRRSRSRAKFAAGS